MKLIHITQLDNSELAIIEKEAAILKQLSHPNIIAFKEVFSIENNNENSNDKLAIIMEYADGNTINKNENKILHTPNGKLICISDSFSFLGGDLQIKVK